MLNEIEKEILLYISKQGLAISERPFEEVASSLNMTEEKVLDTLKALKDRGIIKDLRGVLDHNKSGYKENGLLAWNVPPDKIDAVKARLIANDLISHCYEREPQKEFNYNIFAMMHADAIGVVEKFAKDVSEELGVDCKLLFTERELKREKLDLSLLLNPALSSLSTIPHPRLSRKNR